MLTSLEILLKPVSPYGDSLLFPGSLFQGVLMRKIDSGYAEILHQSGLNPYSQFVLYDRDKGGYVWKISTLTQEAKEKILQPLLLDSDKTLLIENRKLELEILKKEISPSVSYKEMAEKYFIDKEVRRKTVIKFLTNTTFKKNGGYLIFPDIANIYYSLYTKWNSFYDGVSLESPDALDHLISHTKIIGYDLRSSKYEMERVRINCFRGEICLYVSGPTALAGIARLLFAFGEYSGIGAKCSLGMGGVKIE